jgi:phospholipid/cholesterol/gamma-HCH transport system ATP-binding protein
MVQRQAHITPQSVSLSTVLKVAHLNMSFGAQQVLCDFNLELYKGESLVVLGRSGSGKSVLIKCIIGLLRPDSGTINILGNDITTLSHDELDKVRSRIGFLFQSNALYDSMTVRQNLEFPLRMHMASVPPDVAEERVSFALEHVGLLHTIDMMPAQLSGGMQKRVALARTLVLKPDIMLYDEPTTGLDPITGREIATLLNEVQKAYNTSSIIISHDMKCVERTADRIVILLDGRCYATGTFEQLQNSTDEKIKQFFE